MKIFDRYIYRNWVKEKICQIHDAIEYSTNHPFTILKQEASESTVEFIKNNCPKAVSCRSPRKLLDLAVRNICIREGLILEFGVAKGDSLRYLANLCSSSIVHGFDSFEGLPESWVNNEKGSFTQNGVLPKVPKNVQLWKGYFDETLPDWEKINKGEIALLHVDCDLRSSTFTVFEALSDRIVPGTVILFDDYFNFPYWKDDGHAVFMEFAEKKDWNIIYLGYAYKELAIQIAPS